MKKFLFTLVALLMAGSVCAEDYLYVEDLTLTQEQAAAGVENQAIFVKAHFESYVTTVDWTITLPEGVEFVSASMPNAAKPYIWQYVDVEDDDTGEIVSTLTRQRMNPQLFGEYPHFITTTSLGAASDNCYSEDGSICYGAPKWGVDPVEFNFYRIVVKIPAGYTGGDILVHSEPAGTDDPRGNVTVGGEFDKIGKIIVEQPAAEPAPVPTITMSDTYEVSAVCADHTVVLMIDGQAVANPYQITQTYEEQVITFTAYTVANADESGNSAEVTETFTVPAKPLPTLGGYFVWSVLDAEGHFTVEYKNFDYDGPYTLVVKDENGNVMNPEVGDAGEYYQAAEGTHTYTAEVTATGYQPKTDNHQYTYTIPTYAPKPVLTWNEETFTMTASLPSKEYTTEDIKMYKDNELVENPYTVNQTYQPQTIMFKAYVPGKDGDLDSEYAYKEVTVPAKEKTPSAEPTINVTEGDDAYVIEGLGSGEVVMYDAEGNEISNPYTVTRTDEKQIIIITVVNTDEDTEDVMYKPTSKTFTVEVPAKEEVVVTPPTAPQITIDTTDGAIVVGASDVEGATVVLYQCDDAEGTNPRPIDNPTNFLRESENYSVWVYAVATNAAGETASTVTEIVVPAKPVEPDPTAINEMNAGKTIAAVRYFNMAGQEMQEANGMTIVVTTYTDGTTSAVKVMK